MSIYIDLCIFPSIFPADAHFQKSTDQYSSILQAGYVQSLYSASTFLFMKTVPADNWGNYVVDAIFEVSALVSFV